MIAAFVCMRCNKPTSDADRCSTCGMPVKTMRAVQRRGWVAFGAGMFLLVFMGGCWIWVDWLIAANGGAQDAASASFFVRINLACALVILAGILGAINSWRLAHTGRRNNRLLLGMVVIFAAALFLAATASNGYHT
ncbi:MAG: hypothetical protein WAK16_05850 [Candidatus Cybelea sp.]|jgi:hypothetical protein